MPSDVSIRLAASVDALRIARLSRDRIEHGLDWSWTPDRVVRAVADAATNVVVAEADRAMVGFGIMKYRDEDAHLLLLAVDAGAVRRGVGSALVGWLEASARVAGLARAYLEVRAANVGAHAFYCRLGYDGIKTIPGYYQGREASVRMAKDLWTGQPASA